MSDRPNLFAVETDIPGAQHVVWSPARKNVARTLLVGISFQAAGTALLLYGKNLLGTPQSSS
jgi:hypothetical protein